MHNLERYQEIVRSFATLCDQRIRVYEELLTKVQPALASQRAQDDLRPPNFNIFFALGHAYREVATHSAILAHLLDPAASHGQGTRFLSSFLKTLQRAADEQRKSFRLPQPDNRTRYKWNCRREVPLPDLGQADIVLRGPGLLLIIENKIYAGDQENQLLRYWRYVKDNATLPVLVYLTPDGRRPTAYSVGDDPELNEKLITLSYHGDVCKFIQETVTDLQAVSVAEVLRQYLAVVQRL